MGPPDGRWPGVAGRQSTTSYKKENGGSLGGSSSGRREASQSGAREAGRGTQGAGKRWLVRESVHGGAEGAVHGA
jgi:hypothetical protein